MKRRLFLASVPLLGFARELLAEAGRTSSRVVDRLRRIRQERRDALAKNAEGRSVEALNRQLPEIDEIEVRNGARSAKPLRKPKPRTASACRWSSGARSA